MHRQIGNGIGDERAQTGALRFILRGELGKDQCFEQADLEMHKMDSEVDGRSHCVGRHV